MRTVRAFVGGHHQRAVRNLVTDFLRSHLQAACRRGTGLIHGGAANARGADHAGYPWQTVEAGYRGDGRPQDAEIEILGIDFTALQFTLGDMRGEFERMQVGERALPADEGGGPIGAVGNMGFTHGCLSSVGYLDGKKRIPPILTGWSGTRADPGS